MGAKRMYKRERIKDKKDAWIAENADKLRNKN